MQLPSESIQAPPSAPPTTAPTHALSVQTLDSFEAAHPLREQWDQLVAESDSDIYQSYDWCRIWWRHYGAGRKLRIFVFRAHEQLVGIVPMFFEHLGPALLGLRMAKMVGCDSALTLCSLTVQPKWGPDAAKIILEDWLGSKHADAVWFGPLNGSDHSSASVRGALAALGGRARLVRDKALGVHATFNLPATFEEYFASLNKRQRQNLRRDMNLLGRSFRIESDAVDKMSQGTEEFAAFRQMHDAQWQTEGKLGHFLDWPGATDFNQDLMLDQVARKQFRLYRIAADGKVVSYQYGYRFARGFAWRLTARQLGEQWDRFGLGRFGLIKMLEIAISEGIRRVEAGIGHYEYKVQLGAQEFPVHSILISSASGVCGLRLKAFAAMAEMIHLFYYRIWFLRLAPKLPLKRAPLRRLWIKFRL
jgi:CelD/BcsL family acetyltransferase involved in cellulose biosynthesis